MLMSHSFRLMLFIYNIKKYNLGDRDDSRLINHHVGQSQRRLEEISPAASSSSSKNQGITSAVLAGFSDAVAQKISGAKKLQFRRLLLFMLYGFAYAGPFGHYLHKLMDYLFKGQKGNEAVAKKVILEQVTSSPWNNFFFIMYYGLIIEGRSWSIVMNKVKNDYPSVQLAAWKFWPIVGWVNYQYMPLQFRVLFHSIAGACWGIFLNLKARSSVAIKKA